MLSKFNALIKKIYEEIETYNDKPNPPGGFSNNHSDAGSMTGNTCKFSSDGSNVTGNTCNFATDPGNIGGYSAHSFDGKAIEEDAGGAACACGDGGAAAGAATPGVTTGSAMGPTGVSIADTIGGGDTTPKAEDDPGVTVKDVREIYSPALNTPGLKVKKIKVRKYPLISRFNK